MLGKVLERFIDRAPVAPGCPATGSTCRMATVSRRASSGSSPYAGAPVAHYPPVQSLVIYEPGLEMASAVCPREDGHAQERPLLSEVLPTLVACDVLTKEI